MSMEDVNAVIRRWRTNVKLKFRGIASFEERAQLRFDALKARACAKRLRIPREFAGQKVALQIFLGGQSKRLRSVPSRWATSTRWRGDLSAEGMTDRQTCQRQASA